MAASDCTEDSTGRICMFINGAHMLFCFFPPGSDRASNVTYL